MGRGVDQRTLVMLAMDLDQRRADRAQRLHADRLVVDEGAGAAIGKLHAAQDHFAAILQAVGGEHGEGGMRIGHLEFGRDLSLLRAMANEARIAATAQRQRKGIEQDRLAGAGFAGQHRQPFGKLDIKPLDQDDVADRQTRQHARKVPGPDNGVVVL